MQKKSRSSPEKAVEGRAFQVEREQSRWERHTGSFLTPTSSAGFPSFDLWPDWEPPCWSGQMLCLSLYTHRAIHPSAIHTDTYLNPSELRLKLQSPRVLLPPEEVWDKRICSAGTQVSNPGHQTKASATRRLRAEARSCSVTDDQESS